MPEHEPDKESGRSEPTRADYQDRLDKITSIFADMVKHADEMSLTRCPYKNRFDQCTAKFGCRYQDRSEASDVIACTSDNKLDYRSAWESDPDAVEQAWAEVRSRKER